MNIPLYLFLFLSGFFTCYYMPKSSNKTATTTTEAKIVTKIEPAKIVYKDKVREIIVSCPSQMVESRSSIEIPRNKEPFFSPTFKLSILQNPKSVYDVSKVQFGIGYFVNKNASIDLQTNIKLDIINIGVSFYF